MVELSRVSTNLMEKQHRRIVALSAASLVFGLFAVKQTSQSVLATGLSASVLNQNPALLQFGTSVIIICVVMHMMMRSFKDGAQSRYLDRHDALTGLPNRFSLVNMLGKHLSDKNQAGALMLINPGRLHSINTSIGPEAGDAVFLECAKRLGVLFEAPNFVAVSSPGTLAVYIGGVRKVQTINALSNEIGRALKLPIIHDGRALFANHSAGAVLFIGSGASPEEVINQAELALLEAKATRSDAPEVFNASMYETVQQRNMLETEFQEALELGQLERFYQPLIASDGATPVGFEALARWKHPHKGWISPATFIPVAEALHLSSRLGRQIMERACAQILPLGDLKVSVNVTAGHFLESDFVAQVSRILQKTGLPANRLELEITESVLLEETNEAVNRIDALRSLGVTIALDDFGTGYSGLSYLDRFSVDRIKIDASFTRGISKSGSTRSLVETMIGLARERGIAVTVEGIETQEQLEILNRFENLTYQGYLFGPPVPYGDLLQSKAIAAFERARFATDAQSEGSGHEIQVAQRQA